MPPLRSRRRHQPTALVAIVVAVLGWAAWAPAPVAAAVPRQAPALPPPAASILVDVDTGAVLVGVGHHRPLPAASTIKVFSALVIADRLDERDPVPISVRAQSMPARKINVKAGETWAAGDLLHSMLLCSCNDAAVALAEAAEGSLEAFAAAMAAEADRLGMVDAPVLNDPAGLDDEFSFRGGNSISAYDLAIAARAMLADDGLAAIVARPDASFRGGDGLDHRVVNHNRLLQSYPGAIGLKTGFTRRSGSSLVGAARRDGRTLVAVVIDSPNTYQQVAELLDRGFATPAAAQAASERLPAADEEGRALAEPPASSSSGGGSSGGGSSGGGSSGGGSSGGGSSDVAAGTTSAGARSDGTEAPAPGGAAPERSASEGSASGGGPWPGGPGWGGRAAVAGAALVGLVVVRRRQVVTRRRRRRAARSARAASARAPAVGSRRRESGRAAS